MQGNAGAQQSAAQILGAEPSTLAGAKDPIDGKYRVSWEQYNALIERLALQIDDSGYQFDSIVCLARGGLRVGDALSRLFDKPLGVLFTSSYREDGGKTQSTLYISEQVCSARPLPGKSVLLVDDLADSGHTLAEILRRMSDYFPEMTSLRSAVLWVKGVSQCIPDYYVEYLPDSPWIVQPFEKYDSLDIAGLRAEYARKG